MRFKAMTDIKGDRLCVNLGASQVRRRLKGYGFGVRKVPYNPTTAYSQAHNALTTHCHTSAAWSSDSHRESWATWRSVDGKMTTMVVVSNATYWPDASMN